MQYVEKLGCFSVRSWLFIAVCCGLGMVMPLTGCGPSEPSTGIGATAEEEHSGDDHGHEHGHDHDGHDHESASLPDATSELEKVFANISKGFTEGDPESVHGELHDVGHLLEAIETKVKAGEGVAEGKQESAEQAVVALFEGFETLDSLLHGDEDADIDGAKSKISDGLVQLKEALK